MAIREYFIIGAIGILCVFSLAIGVEKMMKIILSNYILISLCLTLSPSISTFMWWLNIQAPDMGQIITPFLNNRTIITLIVYLLALLLLFLKSRISIHFHVSGFKKILLTLLCIPMTIVSIATTLQIAVLGLQAFDINALQNMVSSLPIQDIYKQFIANTPITICIHACITILLLSTMNWIPKINFRRKETSLPDLSIEE